MLRHMTQEFRSSPLHAGAPVMVSSNRERTQATASQASFHLAAEFTAADMAPGRQYFTNGAIVIDDVQLDAMAQSHIQATPQLKAMADAGDKGGAYRQALSAAAEGFARYDGRPVRAAAAVPDSITDVELDRQAQKLMASDAGLAALSERDWSAAYGQALSTVAAGKRITYA
jgi:hypothetical protein